MNKQENQLFDLADKYLLITKRAHTYWLLNHAYLL